VFKGFFKKNLSLKLVSFILALFLWFVVHFGTFSSEKAEGTKHLELPLVFQNLSSQIQVLSAPSEIFATVEGPQKKLNKLKSSDFKAYVDLQGKNAGDYQNLPVHLASPPGFMIKRTDPTKVEVVLDTLIQKKVPVIWNAEKIRIRHVIRIAPSKVIVKGASLRVNEVEDAQVEIPNNGLNHSPVAATPVPVDSFGRIVPGVHIIPPFVEVLEQKERSILPFAVRPSITGFLSSHELLRAVSVSPAIVLGEVKTGIHPPKYLSTFPINITGKRGTLIRVVKIISPEGVILQGKKKATVILKIGR
jgi:YbbR domain-containing protein